MNGSRRHLSCLPRLPGDDSGTTAVEYAVMLALILAVVITGISSFGTAQDNYWGRIDAAMQEHGIH